ncbi:bifunctional DNA primase/polymerase, partial [Streptomyces sp. NPDC051940]|uniref:bifunctional DNA primase/polymerase n=1 Tax=Streptomyces sp. NPDC051940 TaxID=3155675 RepID=UPI003447FA33
MSVNDTLGVNSTAQVPTQKRTAEGGIGSDLLDAALLYVEERHWDVIPGTWLEYPEDRLGGGVEHCSCGAPDCQAPGAHPARRDWKAAATASPTTVRRMWGKTPRASVMLPTGRQFDVVDVPETAGCLALARLERTDVPLGPIAATPDRRMLFFVLPGAEAKADGLLRQLGYTPSGIDLAIRGDGSWIPAPPTRVGTRGCVQWARKPTVTNAWFPDLDDLISSLAYACGRERGRGTGGLGGYREGVAA